jgi:hypothetical protein
MKRLIGVVICSLVMTMGLMATPAAAEPHTYWMWCRTGSGFVTTVTDPLDSTRGYVKFISHYDGQVHGWLDVEAIQLRIDRSVTLADAYRDCKSQIICGFVLGIAETLILSKFKAAFNGLKARLRR